MRLNFYLLGLSVTVVERECCVTTISIENMAKTDTILFYRLGGVQPLIYYNITVSLILLVEQMLNFRSIAITGRHQIKFHIIILIHY
jgi:hypothetical protein